MPANSQSLAFPSRATLGTFLSGPLRPRLSEPKTLITHGRTRAARFLGYEIVVHHDDTKHDRHGHRSINAAIGLKVPMDVVRAKRRTYQHRGKPAAILARAHDSDYQIVMRYQAEFRGIAEYYQLAYNRHRPVAVAEPIARVSEAARAADEIADVLGPCGR